MVGAPISYSGYQPSAVDQARASPNQMYTTPYSPISTLLPYNGLPPPPAASFPPSSAPIDTTYLYPPTTPAYPPNPPLASPPPPFPPSTFAPENLYPPPFPNYPPNPAQNLSPAALTVPPWQQPGAQNLYNQVPCGYPSSGRQSTGAYPPPPSTTQHYPVHSSLTQPGIYPLHPANTGVGYPPPRY